MSPSTVLEVPSPQHPRHSSTSSTPRASSPLNPNPATPSESPTRTIRCRKRPVKSNGVPTKAYLNRSLELNLALCDETDSIKGDLRSSEESCAKSESALQEKVEELGQMKELVAELQKKLDAANLKNGSLEKKLQDTITVPKQIKKDEYPVGDLAEATSISREPSIGRSSKLRELERENRRLAQELNTRRVEGNEKDKTILTLKVTVTHLYREMTREKRLLDQAEPTGQLSAEPDHHYQIVSQEQGNPNPKQTVQKEKESSEDVVDEVSAREDAIAADRAGAIPDLENKVPREAATDKYLEKKYRLLPTQNKKAKLDPKKRDQVSEKSNGPKDEEPKKRFAKIQSEMVNEREAATDTMEPLQNPAPSVGAWRNPLLPEEPNI